MTTLIDGAIEGVAISYTILTTLNVNKCKVFGNPPCLLTHVSSKSSCLITNSTNKAHIFAKLYGIWAIS